MLFTYFDYYFGNFASSPHFFLSVSRAFRGRRLTVVASIRSALALPPSRTQTLKPPPKSSPDERRVQKGYDSF